MALLFKTRSTGCYAELCNLLERVYVEKIMRRRDTKYREGSANGIVSICVNDAHAHTLTHTHTRTQRLTE